MCFPFKSYIKCILTGSSSGDVNLTAFESNAAVKWGSTGEVRLGPHLGSHLGPDSLTDRAEMEREERERRKNKEDDVSLGSRRRATNPAKRIRPLTDLISAWPDKRSESGNVLFPVFPETENTIWTPLPNLPAGKEGGRSPETKAVRKHSVQIIGDNSVQIIGDRKNFATTSPKFGREVSKTMTPLQRVVPPSASSRVVYFSEKESKLGSEKETPLDRKLGSESVSEKETPLNRKLGSESGKFDRVRLGRVSSLISKSARDFNHKKRQEGSPYRYD